MRGAWVTRALVRVAIPIAIVLSVAGLVFVWIGPGAISEDRCLYTGKPDGTAVGMQVSLFPPGTECVYDLPNGEQERSVYVPWMAGLLIAGVCMGTGVLCRRWAGGRLRRGASRPSAAR